MRELLLKYILEFINMEKEEKDKKEKGQENAKELGIDMTVLFQNLLDNNQDKKYLDRVVKIFDDNVDVLFATSNEEKVFQRKKDKCNHTIHLFSFQ